MKAKQAQELRKIATERLGKTMVRVGGNEPRKESLPWRPSLRLMKICMQRVQVDGELEQRVREVEIRTQELEIARNKAAESRTFQQTQKQQKQNMNYWMKYEMLDVLKKGQK